ncbi:TPA: BREX system P-loop protein BrxC [Legionella pneumophila]|nr:BREX system P-loop protein BrxC [Legionella pneumophila]HDI4380952.1 BREX system P-loop protein BrxC [Legionella pneumophila]HDI4384433.1 BREX system P-loop protein BrxC [Legionella pneumophila]HDI4387345.1 BREX system P-loop protein BrxC [Legionella pneumophila]HDI4399889.1 BREX system P-loop protein BrxC [Legionella pneumophila]
MKIEQIFSKKLTRDINGVVKAEQKDNNSVYIELDEYVVTRELDRHFRAFFESYVPSLTQRGSAMSGKIGVWISGFFGSGKSHFLKILSYLLENKSIENNGQDCKAFDFFKNKINDSMLLADIQNAVNKDTDVILFNIDSRANTDDRENAILKVFLKVFNERVGYCADFPHIAHLERELDKRDQYQLFKDKFVELTGSTWEKERDAYDFYRDELSVALAYACNQSLESAKGWVEQVENNFPLDIRNFCKWVNEYLNSAGDRNLLFLVDEVGQFIGKNTQMMLKLQTITEDLGTYCKGRAWVVVTSQADIDAAIGAMDKRGGEDFSKIQGRFSTRLQLSSSNTSEVIRKRLLSKTDEAQERLIEIFAEKGDILRNQLTFDKTTTASLIGYTDAPSFVDDYPFIPYHYTLVQKVFESIRTKGATGKHLAMGERSLLDAFQSAAKQMKDFGLDVLIPFYSFYAPIESFLEPAVKRTIDQACELDSLTEFDGKILKTLFLIRYVDLVKSTLDNLVTLSIDRIDADKIALRKQIEESLIRLERQLMIAHNGDEFIFLTNEEKEIENEIRHTDYEMSEVSNMLSSIVFDGILKGSRVYRYPVNKQDFAISRFCNGHPKDGTTLEDLVIKVISPLDAHYESFSSDQACLNHTLEANGCVLVKLGEHKRLWDDLTIFVRTERFLKQNSGQRPEQEHLLREKRMENVEREKHLRANFEALFVEADIYAIGTKLSKKSATPSAIIEESYKYIIENTFAKLNMLKPSPGEVLRELHAVLVADDIAQLGLDLRADECNPNATREVDLYLTLKDERNEPVYLRDIVTHFGKRPYGWPDNEILLLVARLGLVGTVSFSIQSTDLPLKKAYEPFTSVRKRGEIRIKKIRQHDERQLKKAADLFKDLFSKTFTGMGEKELFELVRDELLSWSEELKFFRTKAQTGHFPGKREIDKGITLIAGILEQGSSYGLIAGFLDAAEALKEFDKNFEDLDDFYNSQFQTWQSLVSALNEQFKANRPALEKNEQASMALDELDRIYNLVSPYDQLRHINPLIEQVAKINTLLIEEKRAHVIEHIELHINRVKKALSEANAPPELQDKALCLLYMSRKRIEATSSIPQLISEQTEAEGYEDEAYDLLNSFIEKERAKIETEQGRCEIEQKKIDEESSKSGGTISIPESASELVKSAPVPKRTVTINSSEAILKTVSSGFIETESEVDTYLSVLRDQLMAAVRAGDRVRIK